MEEMLYTVDEAAKLLKCNVNYIHTLRKKGFIKFMKLGHYKVRRQELERFLEEAEGYNYDDLNNITSLY